MGDYGSIRKLVFTDQFLSFISGTWLSIEQFLSFVSDLCSRLLVAFSALAGLPHGERLLAFFYVYAVQATAGAGTCLLQLCPLQGGGPGRQGPRLNTFDPC